MTTHHLLKRAVDLAACVALVPIALPLSVAAMVAIRLETRGSPLFIQTRVGRGRRPFRLYKLRTMEIETPDLPSHEAGTARVTRVGRFLRRTKLDELPQILNVWNGTMSLVGPRPCLPSQADLIMERDKRGLFDIPPGVTGPAQILGIDMSNPERLAATEAAYFECPTLLGDLRILLRTLTGAGRGDAALKGD